MTDHLWAGTAGTGPAVANPARVYACWLGGKDHYVADREVAREVLRHRPEVLAAVRANRAFGQRVIRYAASGCRIRQFLDIGTGLPASGATHETAQRVHSSYRVVYADNDPVVLSHARALLTPAPGNGLCDYIDADVRDPADLLAQAAATLDLTQPVAVLLLAIVHFLPDADDPAGIVAELAAALAPGSLLAISHVTADYAPGPVADSIAEYNKRVPVSVYARDRAQFTALFGDLPLHWPGVVPVTRWRPPFQEAPGGPVDMYGAVARIPGPGERSERNAGLELAAPPHVPGHNEDDDLAVRAAAHPGHRISRETTGDRTRYVARSTHLSVLPHTVVTDNPDELFAALGEAPQSPPPITGAE